MVWRGGSNNGSCGLYRMGKMVTWEERRRVKGLEVRELEEKEEGVQRAGRRERVGCWNLAFATWGSPGRWAGVEWGGGENHGMKWNLLKLPDGLFTWTLTPPG